MESNSQIKKRKAKEFNQRREDKAQERIEKARRPIKRPKGYALSMALLGAGISYVNIED